MATSWQPIETAPKDGSEVDLWVVTFLDGVALIGGRVTDAWWLEAFGWTALPRDNGDHVAPRGGMADAGGAGLAVRDPRHPLVPDPGRPGMTRPAPRGGFTSGRSQPVAGSPRGGLGWPRAGLPPRP